MSNKNSYPFTLPVLHDYDGDISKRWYIEWKVWNVKSAKLERQRFWGLNREKTRAGRYKKSHTVINEIKAILRSGKVHNPENVQKTVDNSNNKKPKERITINSPFLGAFKRFIELKKGGWSEGYMRIVDGVYKKLKLYLKEINREGLTIQGLNTELLDDFMLWYKDEYNLDNNTVTNSKIPIIKAVVNHYSRRLPIPINPVHAMHRPKTTEPSIDIYTDEEAIKILDYTSKYDPLVFLLINFIFYSCIRPNELRFLKVKHILDDHIIVPARAEINGQTIRLSKNRKTQRVRIMPGLEKVIQRYKLRFYSSEDYIFTTKRKPGPNCISHSYFTSQYKPIVEYFKLPKGKRIYNWKHTGAVKLYQATKDIKYVQRHLRHSSVSTTEIYLRKLMLFDDDYKEVDISFGTNLPSLLV